MSPIVKRVTDIVKSSVDNRQYRGLELSNGLRCLLVSDAEADRSAASMDVNVGHLYDPREIPGVAHFCEHMLFLGTEKYPEENEYNKYLTANAGHSNAYTSSCNTNYHFEVKPDVLEGALDRFVQFFLTPKFTESATDREVHAVDSEHLNNVTTDAWRLTQIERFLSKEGHDYSKFGTGNKKTLADDARARGLEPRDALLKFHNDYYSSNIMRLCVVGKESLDELEEMVCKLGFADIVNKSVTPRVWEQAYGPEECERVIEIVPIKDTRSLTIIFPFPDLIDEYKSHSVGYISHILGHEGSGSLMSVLRRKGWVTSLSAGYRPNATGFGAFRITMDLSIEGLGNTENIVAEVFKAISLIRSSGPHKWIFDEYKGLRNIDFMFKDKEGAMKLAIATSSDLHHIPMEDVLSSPYIMQDYHPERIRELTEMLTPSNMWYRVVAKKFEELPDLTKEPVYETSMRNRKIDTAVVDRFWSALKSRHPEYLHLPPKNDYIAEKFDQKQREPVQNKHPEMILNTPWMRLWFKQDDEFKMPKMITKLGLACPFTSTSPRAAVIAGMTISCLEDGLVEEVYSADLAGLHKYIDPTPNGVDIRVRGFDEKLPLFLLDLLKKVVEFKPDEGRFNILKESLIRNLKNFSKGQPYQLSQYMQSVLLTEKTWTKEQLLSVADSVHLSDIAVGVPQFLSAFHVEMFVHGNATKQEALTMADESVRLLRSANVHSRPLFASEAFLKREHDIGIGNSFILRQDQSTHDASCVQVLFQTGQRNRRENCLLSLLVQIASEPAFNTLRTNETLGYMVFTWAHRSVSAQALSFMVQGPKEPDYVDTRIEAFVQSLKTLLDEMDDETFKKHVEALVALWEEKPKTIGQRFTKFWAQIDCRNYDFEKAELDVQQVRKFTKQDVIDFFDRKIAQDAAERRKLAIYIHPKNDTPKALDEMRRSNRQKREAGDAPVREDKEDIVFVDSVKERLGFYGVPKPAMELPPIGAACRSCEEESEKETNGIVNGIIKAKY